MYQNHSKNMSNNCKTQQIKRVIIGYGEIICIHMF